MNNSFKKVSLTGLDNANQLISLNKSVANKAIQRQLELLDIFASGNKQLMNVLQLTNNPKELVEKQARVTDQYAVIYSEAAKTNMQMVLQTRQEYKLWFENYFFAVNKAV